MKILIAIIFVFLSGCTTIKPFDNYDLNIPDSILYSCKDLPKTESSSDKDLLIQSKETIKLYQECRKWNEEKNKIIKQVIEKNGKQK